ncbi:MAG: LysR family transcriptional regulator [Maritimibacter sp.]|nr:LysR family transcriptional regulator [Maritimibacter sp.]
MIAPRRFLPSMSSLLAFEAVERLGSATAAAEELSLTHSAVSRQLKVLEGQLGVPLFRRERHGMAVTPAGQDYAQAVRDSLRGLSRASLKLRANPSGGSLNLAILPAFGMHWLAPRLRAFAGDHPEITVNLSTRLAPFEFDREPFDAAIHFGQRDWHGVNYLELSRERVVPVCAPGLLPGPATPEALLDLPLLHLESRPSGWEEWFAAQDTRADGLRGMLFDQFATMAEAAALGFGVALLPDYMARAEIARNRLVRAAEADTEAAGRYYLVWPQGTPRPALQVLVKWLEIQVSVDPDRDLDAAAGR